MHKKLSAFLTAALLVISPVGAFAEQSAGEKAKDTMNEAGDEAREAARNAKDEVCEMINGKLECVAKKAVNKGKTLWDKTETEAEELKDKVD